MGMMKNGSHGDTERSFAIVTAMTVLVAGGIDGPAVRTSRLVVPAGIVQDEQCNLFVSENA